MRQIIEWLDPDDQAFWNFHYTSVSTALLIGLALALMLATSWLEQFAWFHFLYGVNLIIHEAGHLIFGSLGVEFLNVIGGTLMQLAMPVAFWAHFLRHSQPKSSDVCLFWIGHNFLSIGLYVADARAQALPPLIEGGMHDWFYILSTFGLLRHDVAIGRLIDLIGCALIVLSIHGLRLRFRGDHAPVRP